MDNKSGRLRVPMGERLSRLRQLTGKGVNHLRLPFSLLIVRYFMYILLLLVMCWAVSFFCFGAAMNMGFVYPANYGSAHMREQIDRVAAAGFLDEDRLPTAYEYAVYNEQGEQIAGNASDAIAELAQDAFGDESLGEGNLASEVRGASGYTLASARLADGSTVVLVSSFMPQFVNPDLARALPNPQNIWLVATFGLSLLIVVAVAVRANHVLTRKMAPLVAVADAVAAQDLDVTVGSSNVAQIDDVLVAMERMRSSLQMSLETQWAAEQRQREQIAALAHDLKTPLTVIRGNADLLVEDGEAGDLADAQVACAAAIRDASAAADAFVAKIIATSRDGAAVEEPVDEVVSLATVLNEVEDSACKLAQAQGRTLAVERASSLLEAADGLFLRVDSLVLSRAVDNVVANACAYAPEGGLLLRFELHGDAGADGQTGSVAEALGPQALAIVVEDEGPGFTQEMLTHARDRFWRGDRSRFDAASGGHWGLGLSIADEIAREHGGSLELENRHTANGKVLGARVTIMLPLHVS